jgi:hypothetical protein
MVAGSEGLKVRLSRSHEHVLVPAPGDVVGVAAHDIDADGDADLVALRNTGQLIVCRNEGGRLTAVQPRGPGPILSASHALLCAPDPGARGPFESPNRGGASSGGLPGGERLARPSSTAAIFPSRTLVPLEPVVRRRSPRSPPSLTLA